MEALRDLADDFNARDPRKLYQLARQRDLDVTQAMAFEALKADVGRQVQAPRPRALGRGAERPAAGRPHRLQPEHAGEDEVRPGGDGRLHPRGRRGTSAEQERRDGGPGHQARRAGADGGRRELRGHDRTGQRVRHALAVVDRGIQTLKKDLATREDVEKQPATEFRVLQDNADKFQHNKDLTNRRIKAVENAGAFRAPTNAARSFNPQYGDVQQLRAVDSMTVRSTEGRETLLKLALPAPKGSSNAAGRLTRRGRPAAVRQLDDFLAPPRPRTLD